MEQNFKSVKSNGWFLSCDEKATKRNPEDKEKIQREANRKTWYQYFRNKRIESIHISRSSMNQKDADRQNENKKKKSSGKIKKKFNSTIS